MIEYRIGTSCIDWDMLTELYGQVGLVANHGKEREGALVREAFEASSKVVTAWNNDELIGAGRMLTDNICYGTIFDVGVLPTFQKNGIGKGIVLELMKGKENLCIYLTSTFGNEQFYGKLGFRRHKTGMAKYPYDSEYLE